MRMTAIVEPTVAIALPVQLGAELTGAPSNEVHEAAVLKPIGHGQ